MRRYLTSKLNEIDKLGGKNILLTLANPFLTIFLSYVERFNRKISLNEGPCQKKEQSVFLHAFAQVH